MAHYYAQNSAVIDDLVRLCDGDVGLLSEAMRSCGKHVERGWLWWRRVEWECDLSDVVRRVRTLQGRLEI